MLKKLIPEGKWSRITLLWSFSQFIIISLIESIIIYKNMELKKEIKVKIGEEKLGNFEALIIYQILYIVALTYQLYLTVDTLLKFSTIDLIALAIFNSMCLVYSITQHVQANKNKVTFDNLSGDIETTFNNLHTYEYINIGIMVLYALGWWYITFRLYEVFGWNVFKQIGADISLKNRLKLFNILVTLLKITFFFIDCLFLVQYFALAIVNKKNDNFSETIPPASITVIGTVLGFVAVAKESRLCLAIYIFTLCVVVGFTCSVFTDTYVHPDDYKNYVICLRVTIVCTVVLSLISYGVSIINFKNFGLGIPKSINKNTTQSSQAERVQQKRLSID